MLMLFAVPKELSIGDLAYGDTRGTKVAEWVGFKDQAKILTGV